MRWRVSFIYLYLGSSVCKKSLLFIAITAMHYSWMNCKRKFLDQLIETQHRVKHELKVNDMTDGIRKLIKINLLKSLNSL